MYGYRWLLTETQKHCTARAGTLVPRAAYLQAGGAH